MDLRTLYVEFQRRRNDISTRIANAKNQDELLPIREEINGLMSSISLPADTNSTVSSIPSYELKKISNSVDSLIEEFEKKKETCSEKKKFKFKSRAKLGKNVKIQEDTSSMPFSSIQSDSQVQPTYSELHCKVVEVEESHRSEYISKVKSSLIHISRCPAADLKDVENSVLFVNSETSLFLTNVQNSIIIGSAQQVRIHDCSNLILGIQVPKKLETDRRIVIENCHGLYINHCVQIDDFSFPSKEGINPNFQYINIDEFKFCDLTNFKYFQEKFSDGDNNVNEVRLDEFIRDRDNYVHK